ncbi:MAG: hypothetical protein ACQEUN_02170 [Pseudomonadota bacterium]
MTEQKRQPLSPDEIAFLTRLANGNALARQRRHDRAVRQARPQPPSKD